MEREPDNEDLKQSGAIPDAPIGKFGFSWKNTVYFRLLATLIIVILPLYVIGTNLYQWGASTIKDQVTAANSSQARFYLDSLETDIRRIQALQYDTLNDEDLNELANLAGIMTDYEYSRAVDRLKQRLKAIKSSSRYIEDVTAYIHPIERSVSAVGGYREFDANRFEGGGGPGTARMTEPSGIMYQSEARVILLNAGSSMSKQNGGHFPQYSIEVKLAVRNMQEAMGDPEYSDGGFMLVDRNGQIIFNSSGTSAFAKALNTGIRGQLGNGNKGTASLRVDGKLLLAASENSAYLGMDMVRYIPADAVFKPIDNYRVWFWIFSFSALLIVLLFSYSLYSIMHRPLLKLLRAFRRLRSGDMQIRIRHNHNDDFNYLYMYFNQTVENLDVLIEQVYRQKILVQKAELKHLQAQINPHFLYNSFFILHRMIKGRDMANSLVFSRELGNYMKYITRSAAETTELANEVAHARSYAEIQAMRFSNRLRVEFAQLPDTIANKQIPRLILQPIIENAVVHGLPNKVTDAYIRVSFPSMEGAVAIVVEDNGEELTDLKMSSLRKQLEFHDDNQETTGLLNIHRRIQLKYGMESGLTVSRSEWGGLKVTQLLYVGDE
ncbi:sensor histidine kinase [Cohnella silvisoli]|uniref:Histidine kinase n=1 Tax=Cohnella silvisoli TaxID=2873699 RepID=A0ABV1KLU4_9BACL|nr:histidine kinase [Cohnella silvisoli]MCD9020608.1 histidine kinase [Cohnella silvisoli]